jgi:hypothetical protein
MADLELRIQWSISDQASAFYKYKKIYSDKCTTLMWNKKSKLALIFKMTFKFVMLSVVDNCTRAISF